MSKFLKLVSESVPTEMSHETILKDLIKVLSKIGFNCKKTKSGYLIEVAPTQDEDGEDVAGQNINNVARAIQIVGAADQALPKKTGVMGMFGQAGRANAAKKAAMEALITGINAAAKTITTAFKPTP